MFISTTPQTIIDDILGSTDEDGYGRVSSSLLCGWINSELSAAWSIVNRTNRDILTKCTSQFSVTSSGNISMTASSPTGVGVTDWGVPRGVDALVDGSSDWKSLKRWSFATRDRIALMSYKFIGDTLYIMPTDQATVYPFRVWYMYRAPTVSASALSTSFDIVDGVDDFVVQMVAAKLRVRLDDDPSFHMAVRNQAERDLRNLLAGSGGTQTTIADVADDSFPEVY